MKRIFPLFFCFLVSVSVLFSQPFFIHDINAQDYKIALYGNSHVIFYDSQSKQFIVMHESGKRTKYNADFGLSVFFISRPSRDGAFFAYDQEMNNVYLCRGGKIKDICASYPDAKSGTFTNGCIFLIFENCFVIESLFYKNPVVINGLYIKGLGIQPTGMISSENGKVFAFLLNAKKNNIEEQKSHN